MSLLPNPLHPAVVHLPIALTLIVPVVVAGALWMIRRGSRPRLAWGIASASLAALVGSAWVATETGQQQEERVEDVVSEQLIGAHEEAAEVFLFISAGVLAVFALGFAKGTAGKVGRAVGAVGTLAVLGAGYNVGRLGGELVYTHGAASAYASSPVTSTNGDRQTARVESRRESDRERGEDRD